MLRAVYQAGTGGWTLEVAKKLEVDGLLKLEGDQATANAAWMTQGAKFEADMRLALDELEKKHAFERG